FSTILSLFARKLGNDQIVEKLINAKNEDDVIEAFS
ncbi:PTS fructose transporter subunit IIA, partial [Streptococcus agalactiae]